MPAKNTDPKSNQEENLDNGILKDTTKYLVLTLQNVIIMKDKVSLRNCAN